MLKINPNGNTAYNYHQFQLIVIIQLIKINPKVIDIEALLYIYLNKIKKFFIFKQIFIIFFFFSRRYSEHSCIYKRLIYYEKYFILNWFIDEFRIRFLFLFFPYFLQFIENNIVYFNSQISYLYFMYCFFKSRHSFWLWCFTLISISLRNQSQAHLCGFCLLQLMIILSVIMLKVFFLRIDNQYQYNIQTLLFIFYIKYWKY